ncbi:DUF1398 domain-containing protein [Pedobacter jamesrossensis]|uniref:DUF1398 domain-containing protein n=1 Tax=Pedobacter jamesrossensis TaxID=1908238 RepID=A0ABV8NKY8_9SPHI
MFTVKQIILAHSKVKSGADFPEYIQEVKQIGVIAYQTWVKDSHTEYFGKDGFKTKSNPKYDELKIAETSDKEKFSSYLKAHQKGETNYLTFCKDCAETGIEKWFVSLEAMICTYFDKARNEILAERIPGK